MFNKRKRQQESTGAQFLEAGPSAVADRRAAAGHGGAFGLRRLSFRSADPGDRPDRAAPGTLNRCRGSTQWRWDGTNLRQWERRRPATGCGGVTTETKRRPGSHPPMAFALPASARSYKITGLERSHYPRVGKGHLPLVRKSYTIQVCRECFIRDRGMGEPEQRRTPGHDGAGAASESGGQQGRAAVGELGGSRRRRPARPEAL